MRNYLCYIISILTAFQGPRDLAKLRARLQNHVATFNIVITRNYEKFVVQSVNSFYLNGGHNVDTVLVALV